MDFLIGAGSVSYGWFAPVFWTRFSSVAILVGVFVVYKLCQSRTRVEEQGKDAHNSARQFYWVKPLPDRISLGNNWEKGAGERGLVALLQRIKALRTPLLLAALAALLESAAMVTFSITARIMQPGVTAAIACNYSLVAVLFGLIIFRERLAKNQMAGIFLVMCGLTLLAIPFAT